MKHTLNTLIISILALIATAQAETELPPQWDLKLLTSGYQRDSISSGQKNFYFKENYTLKSYMLDFTISTVGTGVYFATYRPKDPFDNGLGVIGTKDNKLGIHNSSTLASDVISVSVGDVLRFAYNSTSLNAYLFNVSTNDIISVTLSQHLTEYKFKSGGTMADEAKYISHANANSGKTVATYGDIYDMSSLADNEQAFLSFIKTLSVNPIPEPTSTMLSLYALSMLLIRRKRKLK
ncbi:MAG: hypothetical protein Q4F40_08450 [Akkermansia sp.]|nr:hypothetical protein [Akkermansia sp.]